MRRLFSFLFIILFTTILYSQKPDNPTHTLELLVTDASESVKTSAYMYSENNSDYIAIEFPDELITTKIVKTEEKQYKFQLSQIRNNGLVSIHFIGSGDKDNKISGEFKAMVDGVPRKDMSGHFTIINKK